MITLLQAATDAANQAVEAVEGVVVENAPKAPGADWSFWIMIVAMIAIMYFFMWRPEKKRRKEMQQFRDGLKAGDKVITAGGIYAVVKKVEEASLLIEVDSNVTLRIDKNMVVAAPTAPEK
ncbi:MAG: preprotein translocase subunit YajC [Alistipes sp.]|nr:preprotein translocase subunit YajC [Alistipes sp.]